MNVIFTYLVNRKVTSLQMIFDANAKWLNDLNFLNIYFQIPDGIHSHKRDYEVMILTLLHTEERV